MPASRPFVQPGQAFPEPGQAQCVWAHVVKRLWLGGAAILGKRRGQVREGGCAETDVGLGGYPVVCCRPCGTQFP